MSNRTVPLLLRALVDMTEVHSSKVLKGKPRKSHLRHLVSCGILASGQVSSPLLSVGPVCVPGRSFVNLAAHLAARRMEYSESRTLWYSPEQMYDVVAAVDKYQEFVPWCKKSRVVSLRDGSMRAQLEIGFPPVVECYTSEVTVVPNHQVRAVCTDASLFSHLETVWRFLPGAPAGLGSCRVDFNVSFEFKSLLHCQLAALFFDEVVKQMVSAFETRAAQLYGLHSPAVESRTVLRSKAT